MVCILFLLDSTNPETPRADNSTVKDWQRRLSARRFEKQTKPKWPWLCPACGSLPDKEGLGQSFPVHYIWVFLLLAMVMLDVVPWAMTSFVSQGDFLSPHKAHLDDTAWEPSTLPGIMGRLCRRKFHSFPWAVHCNAQQSPLAGNSSSHLQFKWFPPDLSKKQRENSWSPYSVRSPLGTLNIKFKCYFIS